MKALCYGILIFVLSIASAFATVTVTSPGNSATVTSPVHYVATATATSCAKGVASMGIYVNNKLTYVVNGASLNAQISLSAGVENTVVEEWDYCGGAITTTINLNVVAPLSTYFTDLSGGKLPSLAFIEAGYGNNDEHPGSGQSILSG